MDATSSTTVMSLVRPRSASTEMEASPSQRRRIELDDEEEGVFFGASGSGKVSAADAGGDGAAELERPPRRTRSNSSTETPLQESPLQRKKLEAPTSNFGGRWIGAERSPVYARSAEMEALSLQRQKLAQDADAPAPPLAASLCRDEKYYRPDGDCVVCVEDVLFKIHRYHLDESSSSETSVFRGMFDLPLGDGVLPEGQSDANPIVLYGDTAAQFRAFLSFSYSNPLQLQINRMVVDDLERLSKIVSFAHKYLLQDCLMWALESIEHVLLSSAAMVPADEYPLVLEATALCLPLHRKICEHICGLLQRQWLSDIESYGLPIAPALDIAERLSLRSFLVELYCLILDNLASTPGARRTAADGPLAKISSTHRLRIFSGHWFLSRACADFMERKPPAISHAPACATHLCGAFWYSGWGACAKRSMGVPDHGNLKRIFQKLDNFRDLLVLSRRGFCSGEEEMDGEIGRFKRDLEECFFTVAP